MQAVQSAHAAVELAARCPGVAGGYLIMLTVADMYALCCLAERLELHGVDVERFREPDLDDRLTAIAASGPLAGKKLARLSLLLREEVIR